jgi:hypothetical protein
MTTNRNILDDQIDIIIKNNKLHRFELELLHTDALDEERITQLTKIICNLKGTKINPDNAKNKLDKILNNIDEYTLHKKWSQLQITQKINKIKEYLNDILNDIDNKTDIENKLIELINNGKLKSNKDVIYDSNKTIITQINILKKNSKGKYYLSSNKQNNNDNNENESVDSNDK